MDDVAIIADVLKYNSDWDKEMWWGMIEKEWKRQRANYWLGNNNAPTRSPSPISSSKIPMNQRDHIEKKISAFDKWQRLPP